MSDIPERCRWCANWMGRYSGDPDDRRCNRNWGHEKAHGDFWTPEIQSQDPESEPAYVKRDCKVRRWGPPIRSASDPDPNPKYVDAFVRARPETITLRINGTDYSLTADQLRKYLMADDEELLDAFDDVESKQDQIHSTIERHYEEKYGSSPDVYKGESELPPYRRDAESIPTGILQLDQALNGGFSPGVRINISGKPDSGKSTLFDAIAGAHVSHYRRKVFEFATSMGLSEEKALKKSAVQNVGLIRPEDYHLEYVKQCMNLGRGALGRSPNQVYEEGVHTLATDLAEESTETIIEAMNVDNQHLSDKRGPDVPSWKLPVSYRMIGIDSIDAEQYAEELYSGSDNDVERMGDDHRVSPQARLLAEFFRKSYKAAEIPLTLVMISQERAANIGGYGKSKSVHRGNAHPYFTNLEMYLYTQKTDGPFVKTNIVFRKVHVDANVTEGDEIEVYIVPSKAAKRLGIQAGMNPRVNAIKYVLENVKQHPDAQNGTETLWRNASWVYFQPEGQEEPINYQGTDPAGIMEWLDEEGYLDGLHERLLNDLMNESEESPNGNQPEDDEG